jgi:hypothetical protein
MTQTQQTNQQQGNKYFDLHVQGIGYVSRIREVKVKGKGDNFWCCTIGALRGAAEKPDYTYFDCRISGGDALRLIQRYKTLVEEKHKVLIGFKVGDIYPEYFTFTGGKHKGETGVSIKGHLLFISFVKIDGEMKYQAPKKDSQNSQDETEAPAEKTEPASPASPAARTTAMSGSAEEGSSGTNMPPKASSVSNQAPRTQKETESAPF